jgi:N-acetylglucosaminyl-diphospho-decaprenol L-rhamnosyltransferase
MAPKSPGMHDLAIIVVSTNEARWLDSCLRTVFEHAGSASLDVVVVDNDSTDGTPELVESRFPAARVVKSANHGFGHANNRGALTCSARYVLFLNPDTEVVAGTFGELVAALDERPDVGLVGVRQITADGDLWPTARRFPSFLRALSEALGSEKWPFSAAWSGERELDLSRYDEEFECDWTSGSFMLTRREALLSGGYFDERLFIYSEDPELALRIKTAGWQVRHLPTMTIIHHAAKGGVRPKMVAQDAFSRLQYARKHFSLPYRLLYMAAVALRHIVRGAYPPSDESRAERRKAARLALSTLAGRTPPPFGYPPATAIPEWPQRDSPKAGADDTRALTAAVAGEERPASALAG